MDKDRIIGSAKQMKGAIKKVIGDVIGDPKLQAEGIADQVEGKAQSLVGSAEDALDD